MTTQPESHSRESFIAALEQQVLALESALKVNPQDQGLQVAFLRTATRLHLHYLSGNEMAAADRLQMRAEVILKKKVGLGTEPAPDGCRVDSGDCLTTLGAMSTLPLLSAYPRRIRSRLSSQSQRPLSDCLSSGASGASGFRATTRTTGGHALCRFFLA